MALTPETTRLLGASVVLLGYAGFCGAIWHGWRRKQQRARDEAAALADAPGNPVLVAFASQTGFAEQLAWSSAHALQAGGIPVLVSDLRELSPARLAEAERALFVVSTTGEGDAPDGAMSFVHALGQQAPDLHRLHYGVLALGDRSYARFNAFGRALDSRLATHGARRMFDRVEVDAADGGALRHWQHNLGQLSGVTDAPDWTRPVYQRWRLAERVLLNPGSAGAPAFHLVLTPTGEMPSWQAGDIAEIEPPGHAHREYSIASLPPDGAVHLLVRQVALPDGTLGAGSGWLTDAAPVGAEIALRIRTNRSFHPPADDRPLVLIGAGTGLAGLRAHLRARALAGHARNWLLFGERSAAHDYFHRGEIEAWRDGGHLRRLDLAFSRDQEQRIYVQDRLLGAAGELRRWVDDGAAIYVCGSLQHMAAGVAEVLDQILGPDRRELLAAEGRYRRDVY